MRKEEEIIYSSYIHAHKLSLDQDHLQPVREMRPWKTQQFVL